MTRQPLLDDAASWRSLFDHYDVELTRPDLLVLKRRDSPRYSDPRPIGSITRRMAQRYRGSPGGPGRIHHDAGGDSQESLGSSAGDPLS